MDQDLPQHVQTNDENESNSFDHAPDNDSLDQLFEEITDVEEAQACKQLQLNAILGVLQKPLCGGDAGEPFESEPQIMQTIAEVHHVQRLGEPEPESDEGDGTESESNSDSKIDNSKHQPEPQIKLTEAEERHNLIPHWSRLHWGEPESDEGDVTEAESNADSKMDSTNCCTNSKCGQVSGPFQPVIIHKQLQSQAIQGVLHKPSCGGDAGEPFESKPQIMQTIAEVHYVRHWEEPESEEGDDTESESNSYSKIDKSESQPEPQIQNWGKGDWQSDDSDVEFEWENIESEDDLESKTGDSESKVADSKSNGNDSEPSTKPMETKPTKNSLNASMHNDLNNDKFITICKSCNLIADFFWLHCIQCKDFDLCTVCYSQEGHSHHMETVDLYQNFEQKFQQLNLNQEQSWDKSQDEFLAGTDGALISYWQKRMGLSYNIIVAEKSRFVTNLFRDEFATTQNGNHLVSMRSYGEQRVYELLQIVGGPEMSAFDKSELKEILDQLPENARFVCARSKAMGNDMDPDAESALISKWQRKMGLSYNIIVAPKSRFTTSWNFVELTTQNDHHYISMMVLGEQRFYELLQIVGGPEILDFSKSKLEEVLDPMPGDAKFICGCPKAAEEVRETEPVPEPETASAFFSKWQRSMGPSYTKVINTF